MFPMFSALLESKQWLGCHLDLAWFADISWLILTLQSNALLSCTWLIPASVQMLRVYELIPFYFPFLHLIFSLCWVYVGVL